MLITPSRFIAASYDGRAWLLFWSRVCLFSWASAKRHWSWAIRLSRTSLTVWHRFMNSSPWKTSQPLRHLDASSWHFIHFVGGQPVWFWDQKRILICFKRHTKPFPAQNKWPKTPLVAEAVDQKTDWLFTCGFTACFCNSVTQINSQQKNTRKTHKSKNICIFPLRQKTDSWGLTNEWMASQLESSNCKHASISHRSWCTQKVHKGWSLLCGKTTFYNFPHQCYKQLFLSCVISMDHTFLFAVETMTPESCSSFIWNRISRSGEELQSQQHSAMVAVYYADQFAPLQFSFISWTKHKTATKLK